LLNPLYFHLTYKSRKHLVKYLYYASLSSRRRRTVERTVAPAVVPTVQAPPANTLLHALHFQIPTAVRLTASYNQLFIYFSTKSTSVFCMLRNFHFLYLLTKGSTITGTIFTNNSDFFCSFLN
jgi:hypothetical protein